MSDGYYPEYYLRKRQRDRVYGLVTRLVMVVVLAGGLGCVAGFFIYQYLLPHRSEAGVTAEMADQRQELATEQKLQNSARAHTPPAEDPGLTLKPTELSALTYADSFPMASVALMSKDSMASNSPSASEEQPAPVAVPSGAPETTPEPATPRDDAASAQEPQKASTVHAPEKKPEQAKNTEEKKPSEEKKPVKKDEAAPKNDAPSSSQAKTMYRVYAGSSSSKEQAESIKHELGTLGLSGSLIKSGPDYLVLIATVDEYSKAQALTSELQGKGFGAFSTRTTSKK